MFSLSNASRPPALTARPWGKTQSSATTHVHLRLQSTSLHTEEHVHHTFLPPRHGHSRSVELYPDIRSNMHHIQVPSRTPRVRRRNTLADLSTEITVTITATWGQTTVVQCITNVATPVSKTLVWMDGSGSRANIFQSFTRMHMHAVSRHSL